MTDDRYATNQMSSWNSKSLSTSFYPSRSMQNVSSIPMLPTTNYVVPLSRLNSQNLSQYKIDGRQIQQYQQSKYQPQAMDMSQSIQTNTSITNNKGWCAKHISVTQVIGLLFGLILAGVPLAVVVTMYVQLLTTSNNAATSGPSSTISTSINLPYQCSNYGTLTDSYRPVTNLVSWCSCDSYNGWFRMTGAAGTRLTTTPVNTGNCGTAYPAWFNGSLPTTSGTTTSGVACVNLNGNLCYLGYSTSMVLATNCNGFYVFYLTPLSCCCSCAAYPRYCTV